MVDGALKPNRTKTTKQTYVDLLPVLRIYFLCIINSSQ